MLLSCVQKIFDPLGVYAPVVLIPKIILQKSWKLKAEWDEDLPENMQKEFRKWSAEIHHLNDCRISRRIFMNTTAPYIYFVMQEIGRASCRERG